MTLQDLFPKLTDGNHELTSPKTINYNCIAWAAQNTGRWWQPGMFWPIDSPRDDHGIGVLVLAFKKLGFEECDDGELEDGFEKVALYGSALMYTHAARQLLMASGQASLVKSRTLRTRRQTLLQVATTANSFNS